MATSTPFEFKNKYAPKNAVAPESTTHLTFAEPSVYFEMEAFTGLRFLKSVVLPPTYNGPSLNLVFNPKVACTKGKASNRPTALYAKERLAPLPYYLDRPVGGYNKGTDVVMPGACVSASADQLLRLTRYPYAVDITTSGWLKTIVGIGTAIGTERFITLALVHDGVVYDEFPVPCSVNTVGQLLSHLGTARCVAAHNGVYAEPWKKVEVGVKNYYAVFDFEPH